MSLKSKLKIENYVVLAFSIFYVIVGVAMAFILATTRFRAPHIGVLVFLSFIAAYGLIQMRKWVVLLATVLFFLGVAFSVPVLYSSINSQPFSSNLGALLLNLALIGYVVLLLFAFVYVAAKREKFE